MSKNVRIEVAKEDSSYWATRPYLGDEIRARVAAADVLLVPNEGFRGEEIRSFPVRSDEFFGQLRAGLAKENKVEIAIEDKDYKEMALHGALIVIGTLVVKYVIAPVVVKVAAEYVKDRLKGQAKKESAVVRFEMIVQEQTANGIQAIRISFDGPAMEFAAAMQDAIKRPPSVIVADGGAAPTPTETKAALPKSAEKDTDAKP